MKEFKKMAFIIACIINFVGCVRAGHFGEIYCQSYVYYYLHVKDFAFEYIPEQAKLRVSAVCDYNDPNTLCQHSKLAAQREKFQQLSIKHNDTSWNQWINELSVVERTTATVLKHDYSSITITSDTDYDELHPAGTPLDDIVGFQGYSYKPFFDSGYKWLGYYPDGNATIIEKTLNELTNDDLTALAKRARNDSMQHPYDFAFNFLSLPTASKVHNLKIKFTTDTGSEYVYYTTVDFGVQNEE